MFNYVSARCRGKSAAALALACAAFSPVVVAQYKCTGPDGAVSFQQVPCVNTQRQDAVVLRDRQAPVDAAQARSASVDWRAKNAQLDWQRDLRIAIESGQVLIGMSRAQLYQSIGQPSKINAAQYGSQSKDQLIYYRNNRTLYVYVDNDIVTSFQDTDGAPGAALRPRKPCPSGLAIREIEVEINKLQNRDNQALQVELHKQLKEARSCS